jgi:hypothetical protein
LNEGVDVTWDSTGGTGTICTCEYIDPADGQKKSCGPYDGSNGVGHYGPFNIKTSKTTTFSVKCSN